MKHNTHIEIVSSSVSGLSSMGAVSREALCATLSEHFEDVRITLINSLSDLNRLVERRPDLVFLGMKFLPVDPLLGFIDENKIWLSDYLDKHDVAYTGSSRSAHELEANKHLAKTRVREVGLSTSPFLYIQRGDAVCEDDITLTYPLFAKPSNRGGGMGIDGLSLVNNYIELKSKIADIHTVCESPALIEEYLPGREFSVAILKNQLDDSYLAMPIELIAPADSRGVRILSEDVKTADSEFSLEVVDLQLKEQLADLALEVFYALGARDYGRIDIRLDKCGKPHFLEANLIPSIIEGFGNFPKACMFAQGMKYESMVLRIVDLALLRTSTVSENEFERVHEVMSVTVPV